MHDCFELVEFSKGITSEKIEYSHFSGSLSVLETPFPLIFSAVLDHGQLYVVTGSGALHVYLIDLNEERGKAILLLSRQGFLPAGQCCSVVNMEVLHGLGMIALLTKASSIVQFYDLQSLEPASVLEESAGASYFSSYSAPIKTSVCRAGSETEIRKLKILIAVFCSSKKKLLVYDWEDSIYAGCREFSLATHGKVLQAFWKSHQELMLSTMDFGYYCLRLPQGAEPLALQECGPRSSLQQGKPLILPLARQSIANSGAMDPEEANFLVMQDHESGVFLSWDSSDLPFGLASQRVLWKETPSCLGTSGLSSVALSARDRWLIELSVCLLLGFHFPFILALSASGLEIRALYRPNAMVQSVDLVSAVALDSVLEHYVVVCKRGKMYCLKPVPFLAQLQSLIAAKDYEEAIQLLDVLPESVIDNKHDFMKSIQKNHAIELFTEEKSYEAALALLLRIAVPIADILELYPSLKEDYALGPEDQTDGKAWTVAAWLPFLSSALLTVLFVAELVAAYSALLPVLLHERRQDGADLVLLDSRIVKVYLLLLPPLSGDGGRARGPCKGRRVAQAAELVQFLESRPLQISTEVVEALLTRFYASIGHTGFDDGDI